MGTKIYVSNLPYEVGDSDLRDYLKGAGFAATDVKVVVSGEDGRSRGFGFATLGSEGELARAVATLDGADFRGRPMRVAEAHDKKRNGGSRGRQARRGARGRGQDTSYGWEDT